MRILCGIPRDAVKAGGWPLLREYNGDASIRNLVVEGYQILNF
ncbi:hypothetical protein [Cryobacterium sp. TMT2-4]|nr:hypothetical protein [Cryobacterium sp. TMT2-4]